ncbi:MAG TPA: ATP-binding protein [Vicinamibacterales bacterium]|nr:ATP-binding protein [Vicinamibacterales bacterium]
MPSLLSLALHHEQDVVTARQRAGQIAALLGFDQSEQTRVATAVSEIVRNAFRYTGSGVVNYSVEGETIPQLFIITVSDRGRGIANLDKVLAGRYQSTTGMGIGLAGARRLMDGFHLESGTTGTTVVLKKLLPRRAPLADRTRLAQIARDLAARKPVGLVEEVQRQNQELLRALAELNRRQEELVRLNRELGDTNRGVVALYAELDEKAEHLRRADELKSRFLSNMTHEFRTPVNSILALTTLLEQGPQPEPELKYLRKAAEQLSELVNDLLDLAKVEAGKIEVHPAEFEVSNLFGALRGMLRPMLVNQSVTLVFDEPDGLPLMRTDEGKVSQILRNFISNALKYTERGHVRVSAQLDSAREEIVFAVADTGIGIAPEDQLRIFDEFSQLDNPMQRRFKGTGLGLPLSKRLTELLGGRLRVDSTPGVGSTFYAAIPVTYKPPLAADLPAQVWTLDGSRQPVLVIEDAFDAQLFYEKILKGSPFQTLAARNLREARQALSRFRPAAIILDIVLAGEDGWTFLGQLKHAPETQAIPVLVVSTIDDRAKGMLLGADVYAVKPVDRRWLVETLGRLTGIGPPRRVLLVDDQEATRYVLMQFLSTGHYAAIEAQTGEEGIQKAREEQPDVILLDLGLPDMNGREVLRRLKAEPATTQIPVVIVTSARLSRKEHAMLAGSVAAVVSKDSLTRELITGAIHQATTSLAPGRING